MVGKQQEAASASKATKTKKKNEPFDPLSDKKIKFKKVDLEHALTKEEKVAKKAAKEKEKKKGTSEKVASVREVVPEATGSKEILTYLNLNVTP